MTSKYEFIDAQKAFFPTTLMCMWSAVSLLDLAASRQTRRSRYARCRMELTYFSGTLPISRPERKQVATGVRWPRRASTRFAVELAEPHCGGYLIDASGTCNESR